MSAYSLGLTAGIVVGLIVVFFMLKSINKDSNYKTKYDERQLAVRGRAYMYAFWTMVIACAFMLLIYPSDLAAEKLGMNIFFIPIFLGIAVQVSYCIFKDGYVGLNTNMKKFYIFMSIVCVFNLGFAIIAAVRGTLYVDGQLQGPFMNLLCGILFLVVIADTIIKKIIDSKEA